MARIAILGNAMVLTSSIKLEDLKQVEKYKHDKLTITDDAGEAVFAICTGDSGEISKYGILFDGKTTEGGYATVTTTFEPQATQAETETMLFDKYGTAFGYLCQLEETLQEAVTEIALEKTDFTRSLQVLG